MRRLRLAKTPTIGRSGVISPESAPVLARLSDRRQGRLVIRLQGRCTQVEGQSPLTVRAVGEGSVRNWVVAMSVDTIAYEQPHGRCPTPDPHARPNAVPRIIRWARLHAKPHAIVRRPWALTTRLSATTTAAVLTVL